MASIKINNTTYTLKEITFKDMVDLEDMGFSLVEIISKNRIFSLAAAFAALSAKCSREQAEELCQQHVLSGGSLAELAEAFGKALEESSFFQKLLREQEKEMKVTKVTKAKA